jgi:hypothetical protein
MGDYSAEVLETLKSAQEAIIALQEANEVKSQIIERLIQSHDELIKRVERLEAKSLEVE